MTEGIVTTPPKASNTANVVAAISVKAPTTSTSSIPAAILDSALVIPAQANPNPVVSPALGVVATPSSQAVPVQISSSSSIPAPVASAPATTESSPATASSTPEGSGYGFAYSPYLADNNCKTQEQVTADFAKIGSGYSLVRTYGTDCNQTATVLTAAKANNVKLFAGIYDINALEAEISLIVEAANGDWSSFDTISVGNELVNEGAASPSAVVAAIGTARSLLKGHGYSGKVVTVDTLVATRSNPSLCDNSDYCAVNSHPFYDGTVDAKGAGDFLTASITSLRNVLANKNQEIVITETGWPWQGSPNGAAVPSPANQAAAISAIRQSFSSNPNGVILFTAFNDLWKTSTAAQFEAEKYWGFLGDAPSG